MLLNRFYHGKWEKAWAVSSINMLNNEKSLKFHVTFSGWWTWFPVKSVKSVLLQHLIQTKSFSVFYPLQALETALEFFCWALCKFICLWLYLSPYILSESSKLQAVINSLLLHYVLKTYINNEYILDVSCFKHFTQAFRISSGHHLCFCFLPKKCNI